MYRRLVVIPCILAIIGSAAINVHAKGGPGGKGGGGGGGGGGRKSTGMRSTHGFKGPSSHPHTSRSFGGQTHKPVRQSHKSVRQPFPHSTNTSTHPVTNTVRDKQRFIENRKLEHRRQVADH